LINLPQGKLIQKLKDIGLEDDTVVVFTSDHGDLLMEHGRLNKGSPYKTSAGIPLIIRYPRKIKSGKIIETAYSSVDVAPTILSLLGVKDTSSATFQGVDGSQELTTSGNVSAQQDKIIFSSMVIDQPGLQQSWVDTNLLFQRETSHGCLI
jgi:Arylsulfatase A and related enzymes